MAYESPDEQEFFERGFGLSQEYDADEGMFSYSYQYEDGRELIFTHSPFSGGSIGAKLLENGSAIFDVYKEGVSRIEFQAWHSDKIIRAYFASEPSHIEFRVHYSPSPHMHLSEY